MIGCLQTRVCNQPIIALYFEFETVLKCYSHGGQGTNTKYMNIRYFNSPCSLLSLPLALSLALLLTKYMRGSVKTISVATWSD